MKQMTKEELIEYFIEQLGDNEVLGQVMTIEQISEKLHTIIKEVTYNDEKGNFTAHFKIESDGKGIINFDYNKITGDNEKTIIVHELLHALSTTTVTLKSHEVFRNIKEKCGIEIFHAKYFMNDGEKLGYGEHTAINEGMTDFFTEQITGVKHNGYNSEKSIYKVLSIIIGQDTMIKKAFVEDVNISQDGLEIFREELIAKYGESIGNELNEKFKKVSTLSDQLLDFRRKDLIYGLNENGKRIQTHAKDEMIDTLGSMLGTILNLEHDLNKKIDIMVKLEKMCDYRDTDLSQIRESMSKNILWDLFLDDAIDYTQKLEMIRKIKEQGIQFQDEAIDDVLFSIEGIPELSTDEKIEAYIQLQKGKGLTTERFNRIYDMYVKSGKIIENDGYSKREIVEIALAARRNVDIDTVEKIDKSINESRYYKVGQYYALPRGNNPINTVIFDEKGDLLEGENLTYYPKIEDEIDNKSDIELLAMCFSEDTAKIIAEQIQEKFKEYKVSAKGECDDCGVTIIGNIIRLHYDDWNEKDGTECFYGGFFSVDDNGNLELIPERRKAKNNR